MSGFLPILTTVTAADVATAVRLELSVEMGRIDVDVSTRLATSGYTAPDNAGIAALPTLAEIEAATIPVNIKKVNDVTITGTGIPTTDEWRPA
jgi:hypothetical protein